MPDFLPRRRWPLSSCQTGTARSCCPETARTRARVDSHKAEPFVCRLFAGGRGIRTPVPGREAVNRDARRTGCLEIGTDLLIAVGTPITGRPPQSGRIEARTGLRMMPTSPRSPLSFRTAGFPQYGWKDGVSDGAFPTRRSVQACSRHTLTTYWFASVLRASRRIHECPAQCRVGYAPMHRRGGWVILLPRGPRSSPGCAVPVCHHLIDPIRPTRRHITTSPQGGLYAMPSLCGSA